MYNHYGLLNTQSSTHARTQGEVQHVAIVDTAQLQEAHGERVPHARVRGWGCDGLNTMNRP